MKAKILSFLTILLLVKSISVEGQNTIKALENELRKTKSALRKVEISNTLSVHYKNSTPKKAITYAQRAVSLADKNGLTEGKADALKNVGVIYQLQSNFSQALEYFLEALKLYEKLNNENGIAETLHNVGVVYQNLRDYDKAKVYYEKVLIIDKKTKDEKGRAGTLSNMGDLYYQQDDFKKALYFYKKSLKIRQKINDKLGIAISYANMALVYYTKNQYEKSISYYYKALALEESENSQAGIVATSNQLANVYLKMSKIDSSLYYANRSLEIAENIGLEKKILDAYLTLSDIYYAKGNYEKAFEFQSIYLTIQSDVFSEDNNKKIATLQTSYQILKKEKEIEALNTQRTKLFWLILGLSMVVLFIIVLAIILMRSNKQRKKANELLTQQNAEINQAKEEIEAQRDAIEEQRDQILIQAKELREKNKNIESSINYAQRIQSAMLPYEAQIEQDLPLNFIYYKPRDIVSGDFYWYGKVEARPIYEEDTGFQTERVLRGFESEKVIITAVDCTGHGVPGAFMSMIGDSLLDQIVVERQITKADLILEEMHKGINTALRQDETKNRDGMDISLCVIDLEEKTVEYAGAKNALIYMQNGKINQIKADIVSIGGQVKLRNQDKRFHAHKVSFAEDPLVFYLYSDGFQDQFGGEQGKKFMRRRFKEILYDIHKEPMTYQKELLAQTFEKWKGEESQVDDVLVIGVRLE